MKTAIADILKENKRRTDIFNAPYDPIVGIGSPIPRRPVHLTPSMVVNVPERMLEVKEIKDLVENYPSVEAAAIISKTPKDTALWSFHRWRCHHDFEYWCATSVKIEPKKPDDEEVDQKAESEALIPFILSVPQRKYFKILVDLFYAGVPIRIILLKARQWGGSTLTQIFMAWIQLFHRPRWHSSVVAYNKGQAQRIRGMYTLMVREHPKNIVPGVGESITLKPYEGSQNNKQVVGRGNIIGVGSSDDPESLRSYTFHLLHLSEVGSWKSTAVQNAESLIQGLVGTLVDAPYTMCVKESTAKGVGTYFHREWQRATKGESSDTPVFIAWYEDPQYSTPLTTTPDAFVASWDDYEKYLWTMGATLEQINWYRNKVRDFPDEPWRMQSEYPTTAQEAFQSTSQRVFPAPYVMNARRTCRRPIAIGTLDGNAQKGPESLKGIRFNPEAAGKLLIWAFPGKSGLERAGKLYLNRYCAFLDTGGTNPKADFTSLTILDRIFMLSGGVPEVVAELHCRMDQDLAAWYSARICRWYEDALLAVEVNRMSKGMGDDVRGYEASHALTVLDEIKDHYENLYYRVKPETVQEKWDGVLGFHTSGGEGGTKTMILDKLKGALRDEEYEERNEAACDEMDMYERRPGGKYSAPDGQHDDRVVSRAGVVWLAYDMDPVMEIDKSEFSRKTAQPGGFGIVR